MQRKAACVEHNACQQCVGLQRGYVVFLGHELQQLTHKLTGAGCIGLMVEQQRVVDMAHRHTVMVDDNDAAAFS